MYNTPKMSLDHCNCSLTLPPFFLPHPLSHSLSVFLEILIFHVEIVYYILCNYVFPHTVFRKGLFCSLREHIILFTHLENLSLDF